MSVWQQRPWRFFGLLFYVAGTILNYPAVPLGSPLGLGHFLATLFFFLAMVTAAWAFGTLIAQAVLKEKKLPLPWTMGVGLALMAAVAFVLALIGWPQSWLGQLLKGMVMLGLLLASAFCPQSPSLSLKLSPPVPSTAILLAYLCMALLVVSVPHVFWDSMWYHLTAPRQWFMAGKMFFTPAAPIHAQASFFECLFLYGNALLSSPLLAGHNLWQVQIFCQWLHFLCVLLSLAALFLLFSPHFSSKLSPFLSWGLFFIVLDFPLHYSSLSAKNDWGLMLWALTSWFLLSKNDQRAKKVGLLLLGLTVGAKFSYAFFALLVLILHRQDWAQKKTLLIWFFPLLLLVCGRNWWWTTNPVFPTFEMLFSTDLLGPTWKAGLSMVEGGIPWEMAHVQRKLRLLFWPKPLLLFGLFFPLALSKVSHSQRKELLAFFAVGLCGVLFIFFKTGPEAEFRLLACAHVFLILSAFWAFSQLVPKKLPVKLVTSLGMILTFALSRPFDIPTLGAKSLWRFYTDSSWDLRQHLSSIPGNSSAFWLAQNARAQETIFLLSDPKLFYLADGNVQRIWDNALLDQTLGEKSSARDVLLELAKHGRYLTDSIHDIDSFHPRLLTAAIIAELKKYPAATVFSGPGDWAVDLKKLQVLMGE